MACEVFLFLSNGHGYWNCVNNIFLGSVLNTDITHAKWNLLIHNHAFGVGTSVHDVNFGDDTDSADTLWVELSRHLETVGGSHISVGRHDTKNDGARITDVPVGHGASDLLNVVGLVCDSDTCDTGQVNQS